MTQLKKSYAQTGLRETVRNFNSAILVVLCAVNYITLHAAAPEVTR